MYVCMYVLCMYNLAYTQLSHAIYLSFFYLLSLTPVCRQEKKISQIPQIPQISQISQIPQIRRQTKTAHGRRETETQESDKIQTGESAFARSNTCQRIKGQESRNAHAGRNTCQTSEGRESCGETTSR
jgi:hypothetical protein